MAFGISIDLVQHRGQVSRHIYRQGVTGLHPVEGYYGYPIAQAVKL
jgi:hypothetical protein